MKSKTFKILITGFTILIAMVLIFTPSPRIFQQEQAQNSIRILIDKPMDAHHFRIAPLINDNKYSYLKNGDGFRLIPPEPTRPELEFELVRDENTRALYFLKGEADVLYDTLSIAKTEWLKRQRVPGFAKIHSSSGETVSHLAFNRNQAFFQDPKVIHDIRNSLPIQLWSETVFSGWVEPEISIASSPVRNYEKKLVYLSTSSREGQQMAFLTREALKKIGIEVEIHVYENSLFYSKIKNGDFDLFSSTQIPGVKSILDLPSISTLPLFRWKHGLILNSRVVAPDTIASQLDYSFRFLAGLQLNSSP